MRKILFFLLLATGGCRNSGSLGVPANQVVSYPLKNGTFVVLVVEDNGIDAMEAKKTAMQKAAQITLDHGYRYFSVLSEETVQVAKTSGSGTSQAPGNLYQEKIVQKDFGRQNLEQSQSASTNTYPALRLQIECFVEKPSGKTSYDAQQLAMLANAIWIF